MLLRAESQADDLLQRFQKLRQHSISLCESLIHDDHLVQATDDVSPPKWHLAHTTWFFDKFILRKLQPKTLFRKDIDFLFNSYYQSIGDFSQKPKRHIVSRPGLDEVIEYRQWVDAKLTDFLRFQPEAFSAEALDLLEIGIQHEQQHQELMLMDIKRNFFAQATPPTYSILGRQKVLQLSSKSSPKTWMNFEESQVEIGHSIESGFSFDNERPMHIRHIHPFQIASGLVTNEEFFEFVEDGGYKNANLWLSDGWDWIQKEKIEAPLYWQRFDDRFYEFSLLGYLDLPNQFPVSHISYYEAAAFAKWKKCRLPTEFEWELAEKLSDNLDFSSFLETDFYHPVSTSTQGQLWQWTSSAYEAYPGFESYTGHLEEYNSKFMCNQLVLRGGCIVTARDHYRSTYRNFYYPHHRWCFSGLRLARGFSN